MPRYLISLALLVAWAGPAVAEQGHMPFIAPIFTDHLVMQRDQADPVWGWSTPGDTISVSMGGRTVTAIATADGAWMARLTPPTVGGPYELTIVGAQTMTIHDVLVGDVWVCAGQSNMEFGLTKMAGADDEIAQADHPQIRLCLVPHATSLHPNTTVTARWALCTPATVREGGWGGFSAVGYCFGRELHRSLEVPIGLIETAWGGTPAEAWTSRDGLKGLAPAFDLAVDAAATVDHALRAGSYDRTRLFDEWYAGNGMSPAISRPGFDASSWGTMHHLPHLWGSGDDPALGDFQGAVCFRKDIDLPATMTGKAAELSLGSLDDGDETWINGIRIGRQMGLGRRTYPVPAGLLVAGRNAIAVWLYNGTGPGGMAGKPNDLTLTVAGLPPVPLAGDWQYRIMSPIEQLPSRLFAIDGEPMWSTALFNGMVAPLAPVGVTGVIWYQGEANVDHAWQYRTLLPALISSWRSRWQRADLPFLIVQLPNFGPASGAQPRECPQAELREAQALTVRSLPDVGLVTTIDIGDPGDLHPTAKQEVGRRLSLLAQAMVYHQHVAYSGPVYSSLTVEGSALRIHLEHADGLCIAHGNRLMGFAVAGADRIFHWAEASVAGNDVIVGAPEVPSPVAARYNWDWSPIGNLSNLTGLPAVPFRTDTWPCITENRSGPMSH